MQTRSVETGPGVEIACDESGFSGSNLVRTDTKLFAHASVLLAAEEAAGCVDELRDRAGDRGGEFKSTHLVRARDPTVLAWFLGEDGPLAGVANIHVTDKTYFVVERLTSLLLGTVTSPLEAGLSPDLEIRSLAVTLHRHGPAAFGARRWQAFLDAANAWLTGQQVGDATPSRDGLFGAIDALGTGDVAGDVGAIVGMMQQALHAEHTARRRLLDDPKQAPATDLFVPAILAAVRHWSAVVGPVTIVHDEQSALTRQRIAQLQQLLIEPGAGPMAPVVCSLSGLHGADSRSDPRVQVADLVAGLARRIASDELDGHGDRELTGLLRPFVDPASIWQDARSWSALTSGGFCP